jgi:endogenous inhibitor of DNA gyrase (YacG/DUF329 family)
MLPLRPDRPLLAPIWICPICQKLMRTGTIEIADGKEQTKLACATCGTQATQSELPTSAPTPAVAALQSRQTS